MPYFNPRSSCEERLNPRRYRASMMYFNPRSSGEERPAYESGIKRGMSHISIHAPHARSDSRRRSQTRSARFQSTLLMRGATELRTDADILDEISIHAPHARSDGYVNGEYRSHRISIHAPHARSDRYWDLSNIPAIKFQSTLLMRGATSKPPHDL